MPSNGEDLSIGEEAWSRIKVLGLPLDPPTFAVFFEYVAGRNEDVNRDVNSLLEGGRISRESLQEVFDRRLSPVRHMEALLGVGAGVSDEIEVIAGLTESACGAAVGYGEELQIASQRLGKAQEKRAVASIVRSLAESTDEIIKTNAILQQQIKTSETHILKLQESIEIIHVESMTDPLTGVANRKLFEASLARMIERADRNGAPLSLLIVDVDNFKRFNDQFGHRIGDAVLRLVASALKSSVRGSDVVARYGGDEFAILLPRTSLKEAFAVGENVRRAVSEKTVSRRSSGEAIGRISLSIGIAEHEKGAPPDAMVENADSRLYAAKRNGRNCVVC